MWDYNGVIFNGLIYGSPWCEDDFFIEKSKNENEKCIERNCHFLKLIKK